LIPGPKRGYGSWAEFIERHFKTVWATDFFTKTVWTMRGPVTYYILFFIHLHTRRVHIAGMTPNPDGDWMAQAARNMSMIFAEERPSSNRRISSAIETRSSPINSARYSKPTVSTLGPFRREVQI